MRRYVAAFLCLLTTVSLVSASTKISNPLIHSAWTKTLDKAENLAAQGDYNHALALVSGGLYTKGITVGLDERSTWGSSTKAHRAFERAMSYWQNALGSDCPFRTAYAGDLPDAKVVLVDSIPGSGDELGLIEMKKNYEWTKTGYGSTTTAKISIVRSFEGKTLTEDEMTETMAHEMGHLLGLADVDGVGYLMGPMDRDRLTNGPTIAEVDALLLVRQAYREELSSLTRLSNRRRS